MSETGKAPAGKIAVLYDGECPMCTSGAEKIRRFDNAGVVETISLHDPSVAERFPNLDPHQLLQELHVVDERGQVYRGARALNEILRHQHGARRWLAYLWYAPGYAWLADRQYKKVAASRYQRDGRGNLKAPTTAA